MKYYLRLFSKKLFLFIIICNSIFNIVTGTEFKQYAVPPADGWVPSEMILDRTEIPKNILLGVTIGGWNHLRHILTIANILADRGYNLTLAKRGKFLQSEQYPKINFISLGEEIDLSKDPETIQLVKEKVDVGRFKKVFKNHYAAYDSIFLRLKEISEMIKPDLFFCDTVNNEPCFDVAWLMKKPLVGISTSPLGLTHTPYRSDPIFGLRAGYGLPSLKSPFERWQNSLFLVDNFFGYETPVPLPPLYQYYLRLFSKKLFLFIIICNSIFNIVTGTEFKQYAVPPADGWVPSEMILDRTEIPKKYITRRWNHLRHILTIANILADRGYNLTLAKRGKFLQSEQYPKINFISLGEEIDLSKDPETIQLVKEKVDVGRFKKVFKNHYAAYDSIFLRLKEISEMIKPDLFFCDTVNNEPCFDVAWLMKKPLVGISTSPLGLTHTPYRSDPIFGLRAGYGLPSLKSPFERWQNSLFLVDNFFGYETPVPLPPLYQEIGPLLKIILLME
ncbi:unnamed protein product [Rhizophagus irregularis]|nr:unnamed protein product [Rhizophagus irregularis]